VTAINPVTAISFGSRYHLVAAMKFGERHTFGGR